MIYWHVFVKHLHIFINIRQLLHTGSLRPQANRTRSLLFIRSGALESDILSRVASGSSAISSPSDTTSSTSAVSSDAFPSSRSPGLGVEDIMIWDRFSSCIDVGSSKAAPGRVGKLTCCIDMGATASSDCTHGKDCGRIVSATSIGRVTVGIMPDVRNSSTFLRWKQ